MSVCVRVVGLVDKSVDFSIVMHVDDFLSHLTTFKFFIAGRHCRNDVHTQ